MTLSLGCDHGGVELKDTIRSYLATHHPEITLIDRGTHGTAPVHYPDFANMVAQDILSHTSDLGILICGTGIGISIRANRFKGIRAALVYDMFTAQMCKAHNNANILCLGGRTTSSELACQLVETWLSTPFEGGRHQIRVEMLDLNSLPDVFVAWSDNSFSRNHFFKAVSTPAADSGHCKDCGIGFGWNTKAIINKP